jgi:hypothetical protein
MDKGHTSRPYDDLNTINTDDTEDADMEEGEKEEGSNGQPSTVPRPPGIRQHHPMMPPQRGSPPLGGDPNLLLSNLTFSLFNPNENPPPSHSSHYFGPAAPHGRVAEGVLKQFDFRHNKIPEGVAVIGEGELEVQQDKSTALVLGPKSCLSLNRIFHPTSSQTLIITYVFYSWVYSSPWRSQIHKQLHNHNGHKS